MLQCYMGQSNSTVLNNTATFCSDIVFNTVVSNKTTCGTTSTTTQDQQISVDNSGLAKALQVCYANNPGNGQYCNALVAAPLTVDGATQGADITLSTTCSVDSSTTAAVQQNMAAQVENKINQTGDAVGEALKSLVQNMQPGSKTSSTVVNSTTIRDAVNSSFNVSNINEMIQSYAQKQQQYISLKDVASGTFKNVSQNLKVQVMADLVAKNAQLASAVQAVQATANTDTTQQTKGLTDIVSSVTGFLKSAVGMYVGLGAIVVCALLCCCFLMVFLFSARPGTGAKDTSSVLAGLGSLLAAQQRR